MHAEAGYGGAYILSSPATLLLQQTPTHGTLDATGMVMKLPGYPVMAGDEVTIEITANTGGEGLFVCGMEVTYDSDILDYESIETSSLFTSAVEYEVQTGILSLSTSGLSSGVDSSLVTGPSVEIMTLTFSVLTNTEVGVHSNVLSLYVSGMVNEYTIKFAEGLIGQVNDERGGAQNEGQLTVEALEYVGVFAYASNSEIVNTAPLDGNEISQPIEAEGVYNLAGRVNGAVTGDADCNLLDLTENNVMSVSSCTVKLASTHERGAKNATVVVGFGSLKTTVAFRVWFPSDLRVDISDADLGLVFNASALSSSCTTRYQHAKVSAYGWFVCGSDDEDVVVADETELVSFVSGDEAVVSVDGNIVRGARPGSSTVSVALTSSIIGLEAAYVTVSDNHITEVLGLDVVIVSGAEFRQEIGSVDMMATVEPEVTLLHTLSTEVDEAYVVVYAIFDDGTYDDITGNATLYSTSTSIAVVEPSSLIIAVGAVSVCGPVIEASWEICGATFANGSGVVMSDMPAVDSVRLSSSASKITKSSDASSYHPFSISSSITQVLK